MLKQRLITAAILIPLFLGFLGAASDHVFYGVTSFVALWGAWEWSGLMGLFRLVPRLTYVLLIACLLFLFYLFPINPILYITAVFWIIATFFVWAYPRYQMFFKQNVWIRGVAGAFVLIPCWLSINFIRHLEMGKGMLLLLFLLIWGADSAAYFGGKHWGKHKLLEKVSPGKTWEGVGCALLLVPILAAVGSIFCPYPFSKLFFLCVVTVLSSVVGDLFESMMKRQGGVKDSGRGLPGHGGILDRIDSATAAIPLFALGIVISHWI